MIFKICEHNESITKPDTNDKLKMQTNKIKYYESKHNTSTFAHMEQYNIIFVFISKLKFMSVKKSSLVFCPKILYTYHLPT